VSRLSVAGKLALLENTGKMCRVQKGKELNDFQRIPLDIEILSNLRFGSLEIRDTSVTRVTNKFIRFEGSPRENRGEDFEKNV
jgi:hypothetical protein